MTKYQFNQSLFFAVSTAFVLLFWILWQSQHLSFWQSTGLFIGFMVLNHYLLNLIHISSHLGLSRNRKINDFLGHMACFLTGVAFTPFRSIHNLHHASPNDPKKDPDVLISTGGSLWWISIRILYQDYIFFTRGLFKIRGNLRGYILDRTVQIVLILWFVLNGKSSELGFWGLTMLAVGTLYGLFQFYFPHYSTKYIDRIQDIPNPNLIQKSTLFCVNLSRYYHFKHHQKVSQNSNYFPLWSYLKDRFEGQNLDQAIKKVAY